jgi:FkbM family methyltransferase
MNIAKTYYQSLRRYGAGLKGPLRYRISKWGGSLDAYLKLVSRGVIHVGASDGQERFLYSQNRLKVFWIEPIPEIFIKLQHNINAFPDQRALCALIADKDGHKHTLHISNNCGMSSSIFELDGHREIWPDVEYVRDITLESITLQTALQNAGINVEEYEVLVMDTQGSELLVLKGAEALLQHFTYIRAEAADFEIYKGCCTGSQIVSFLEARGFRLVQKDEFARRKSGGTCFELLFARKA